MTLRGLSRRSPRRVAVRRDLVVNLSGSGMLPQEIHERVCHVFDPATKLTDIYNDLRFLRSRGRIAPVERLGAPRQPAVAARRELASAMLGLGLRPIEMLEHYRREIDPSFGIRAIYEDIRWIVHNGPPSRNGGGGCRE